MSKKNNKFLSLLTGVAIGASLGVLFAPKKGEETRRDLKKAFDNLADKIKEIDLNEVKENFELKVAEIKMELEDLNKEKVLKIAKAKGDEILAKVEQLREYAIEQGTPIIEDATDKLRENAVKAIKGVLKQIEKKEVTK